MLSRFAFCCGGYGRGHHGSNEILKQALPGPAYAGEPTPLPSWPAQPAGTPGEKKRFSSRGLGSLGAGRTHAGCKKRYRAWIPKHMTSRLGMPMKLRSLPGPECATESFRRLQGCCTQRCRYELSVSPPEMCGAASDSARKKQYQPGLQKVWSAHKEKKMNQVMSIL